MSDPQAFLTSSSTASLDAKLALVQGEIQAASKDRENPFFNSRYATLASVWDACRLALSKNGVSVTQWPSHSGDNRLHLVTRLAHNGEWMRSEFSVPVAKQDPQGYGSAITYARRFALAAAVGVVADEDDDGNAASEPPKRESKYTPPVTPKPAVKLPATVKPKAADTKEDPQIKPLRDAMALHSWNPDQLTEYLRLTFGVERAGLLNPDQMTLLLSVLRVSKPDAALKEAKAYAGSK